MSDRLALLLQAMDAVDPRLDDDRRADAAVSALAIDPILAGSVWAAVASTVLTQVAEQSEPAAVDQIMNALAIAVVDAMPVLVDPGGCGR